MRVRVRRQKSAAVENGRKSRKSLFPLAREFRQFWQHVFSFSLSCSESNCLRGRESIAMTKEKWCWKFLFIHFPNVHFIVDCHSKFTPFGNSSSTWNQSNNFCSSTTTTSDELAHQFFSFVLSIITSRAHNTKTTRSSASFVCVITKGNFFF